MFFKYGFLIPTQDQMSQNYQGGVRESVYVFVYMYVIWHGGVCVGRVHVHDFLADSEDEPCLGS